MVMEKIDMKQTQLVPEFTASPSDTLELETFERVIDTSIAYLVGRTSRAIIKRLTKKFADAGFDVSYEQWSILVHLYRKDGQTQQELSNVSVKDKAAITRLLNVLEKKNIVLRVPDRSDKRSKLVYLTHTKPNLFGMI